MWPAVTVITYTLGGALSRMHIIEIITKKRDGEPLSRDEILFVVRGATDGSLPDYQLSALLMAIVCRGMTREETAWLTDAMARSGERLDLSGIPGPKVDKHSTGGVGDKASLVLAPLAAACGVVVPMMAGRALGHTGGTIDKLESIPGYRTALDADRIVRGLADVGCVIVAQTAQVAPADRRLYALRDVTGTVESIPLITASIMSKKIAEGIGGLVLDVKVGRGAFMKTLEAARSLAESLVWAGNGAGVRTEALLTRMEAPLGLTIGNALEVIESIETLKGRGPADIEELSVALAARMLLIAGVASSAEDAEARVRDALASGRGLEKLRDIVAWHGGDPRAIDDYGLLPRAPIVEAVGAPRSGRLTTLDAELLGRASMGLGAGRNRVGGAIDLSAGIVLRATPGRSLRTGETVLEMHAATTAAIGAVRPLAEAAIGMSDATPPDAPLILGTVR
jgi:pyrimidine-nucleoside phosphorylase